MILRTVTILFNVITDEPLLSPYLSSFNVLWNSPELLPSGSAKPRSQCY